MQNPAGNDVDTTALFATLDLPANPAGAEFHTDLARHVMGIWPHPDDEAYLSAGLMARMTDAGRSVTVLTFTRGKKGTSDPADFDKPHFAAHRERELRASLAEVGVHDVRVVGYRDGARPAPSPP